MIDHFPEGPECDFCNITLDEDEDSLQPIYVGGQQTPKPHHLLEVKEKSNNRIGHGYQILGIDGESFVALYRALKNCPDIELNFSPVVDEVRSMSGESHFVTEDEPPSFKQGVQGDVSLDTHRNKDLAGVSLKINPKQVEDNPDAMVCEDCANMFKNMSE